ncbi:MAG: hypothetical protein IJ635_00595 [Bacteroidaceae bacterium]|nr:hypothetical protein [Bacteroidaceae bacterium]
MKRIIFFAWLLATAACLPIRADYSDHRNHQVDSLETALNSGKKLSDEQRMDAYKGLMWGYQPIDGKRAEAYARKALALSYRHPWLNTRADALRVLGLIAYGSDRYDEAEAYFMQALAVTDSMRTESKYDEKTIDDNYSTLYGSLGNLYNIQDKTLLAIEYYQKAEPIFLKYQWKESHAILHHNIAELYFTMGNNEEAAHHYLKAVESGEASGDSLLMSLPRKGLVKVYIAENKYQKARETIMPAYHYYRAHSNEEPNDYAEVLASMVKLHLMDGHEDLPRAKTFAKEALTYADRDLMSEVVFDIYAAAAMIAMRESRWNEALAYAQKAIHENDDEATFGDIGCYEMLANIYIHLGQTDEASRYIKKMRTMMEQFATDHYQSGLSQMEVLYETEKKEAQIRSLAEERRLYRWMVALAAVLLVAAVVLIMYRHLANKRQRALLAARVALETETRERQILAKDLHDGLGGMLSVLRLNVENGMPKEETLQMLDSTMKELRHVAHHIMPEELLRKGLKSALTDFAISASGVQFHYFGDETRIGQDRELVLYRCAYELVNNAIKHAEAERIDIQLMKEEKQVTLTVCDNGKGFDPQQTLTGMGLENIRNRIAAYGGDIHLTSQKGKGTEIHIILPL